MSDTYDETYFQTDSVVTYMSKFRRGPSQTYTLITPDTPLHELEEFLKHNLFALGMIQVNSAREWSTDYVSLYKLLITKESSF